MDEDTSDAAWAQLELEARRWEEAIAREQKEFQEWLESIGALAPGKEKVYGDHGD